MRRLALVLLLAACEPVDVVMFDLPDGGGPPHGPPCAGNPDCPPQMYCDKPSCEAPVGHCQRPPLLCDDVQGAVCGCDGVSYWNDCRRRAAGINGSTPGECATPLACTGPGTCPAGTFCARLDNAATCPATPSGACYDVPVSCPALGGWAPCDLTACRDFCAAVRSEQPHARLVCP